MIVAMTTQQKKWQLLLEYKTRQKKRKVIDKINKQMHVNK